MNLPDIFLGDPLAGLKGDSAKVVGEVLNQWFAALRAGLPTPQLKLATDSLSAAWRADEAGNLGLYIGAPGAIESTQTKVATVDKATGQVHFSDASFASIAADITGLDVSQPEGRQRNIGEKLGEAVTARDYMVGDVLAGGSTDDSAGLAKLQQHHRGAEVGLGGQVYAVGEVPTKLRVHGGGFKIGAEIVAAPAILRPHPFAGQPVVLADNPGTSWAAGVWHDQASRNILLCELRAGQHDAETGSCLDVLTSYDTAATFGDRRTIFSDRDNPRVRAAALGPMSAGRAGGLACTGPNGSHKFFFVRTDDGGETFAAPADVTVQISGGPATVNRFIYGQQMPGPSGAAGDFLCFTYNGPGIGYARTLNNGLAWSWELLRDSVGLPGGPLEPIAVEVPGRGWIVLVRTAANTNLFGFTIPVVAGAFGAPSPWVDAGVLLGSNPVHAVYDGGLVHVLIMQRTGFPGTIYPDQSVNFAAEAGALFDDLSLLGRLAPQQALALPRRGVGYPQSCRISRSVNDKLAPWLHVLKSEGPSSTGRQQRSQTVILRDLPAPTLSAEAMRPAVQLLDNPMLGHNCPRGTSWSIDAGSGDLPLSLRWRSVRSGADMTVTQEALTEAESLRYPFRPGYGLRLVSSGNDFAGLSQRFEGEDARQFARVLLASGDYLARLWADDVMPAIFRIGVAMNGAAVATGEFKRVGPSVLASWVTEAMVTLTATPPSIEAITTASVTLDCGASMAAYNFRPVGVFLYNRPGVPLEAAPPKDTADRVALYYREWGRSVGLRVGEGDFNSSTSATVVIGLGRDGMMMSPTAALSNVADWELVSGTTAYPISAISFAAGRSQIVATVTTTGAPASGHCQLRAKNANALLRADSNY